MIGINLVATGLAALGPVPVHAERVTSEISIAVSPDQLWSAVRDVYAVDRRLVPGVVAKVDREGDVRHVTFANGFKVSERIVAVDETEKMIVYEAFGGRATFHRSTMQVIPEGAGAKLVWTSRFLPAELRELIAGNMKLGIETAKRHLETQAAAPR